MVMYSLILDLSVVTESINGNSIQFFTAMVPVAYGEAERASRPGGTSKKDGTGTALLKGAAKGKLLFDGKY